MSTYLDGLARLLHEQGHGTYTTERSYADDETGIVLGAWPSHPDRVVVLTPYGGSEADAQLGYDEPHVQLRVRGTDDVSAAFGAALAIYDDWHGLGPIVVPTGHEVMSIVGLQSGPVSVGWDDNGRYAHTLNFRVEWRNNTDNRH